MQAFLDALTALLKVIPLFNKWFTKTAEQQNKDVREGVSEEEDKMKQDGRPKWG